MSDSEKVSAEVRNRIAPTLLKVSNAGLRAWLKTLGLPSPAVASKPLLTDLIAKLIVEGELSEPSLEQALIGFEEASGKRIYLFDLEDLPSESPDKWLPGRFSALSIPLSIKRIFTSSKSKPMSAVYGEINGNWIRIKWTEVQHCATINPKTDKVDLSPVDKTIVLIADLKAHTAELRLDPPENRHSYDDVLGQSTADAYYNAYMQRCKDVLGCTFNKTELRQVIQKLVEEVDPRVVRIHIDHHTNQKNTKFKTTSSRADVRDDEDWKNNYETYGAKWAWDFQSFYWLPKPSAGSLKRELVSHIEAVEGFVKVNADCSNEEVEYAISQVRAR